MFYAYILLLSNNQFYIGYTNNLKRRFNEHKNGKDRTTKKYLPLKLIFYEAFCNKEDAKRREHYFKSSKGKATLRMMLRNTLKDK